MTNYDFLFMLLCIIACVIAVANNFTGLKIFGIEVLSSMVEIVR